MESFEIVLAELAERERMTLDWLAKDNLSEKVQFALEEYLRRIRENQRSVMLRQYQSTEKGSA